MNSDLNEIQYNLEKKNIRKGDMLSAVITSNTRIQVIRHIGRKS